MSILAHTVVNSESTFWSLVDLGGKLLDWLRGMAEESASASLCGMMGVNPRRGGTQEGPRDGREDGGPRTTEH